VDLSLEACVKTHHAGSIACGDGTSQMLTPGTVVVRVLFRKPLAEPGVPIYFVPVRNGLIQRPFYFGPLGSLRHLPELDVLSMQTLKFRPDSIDGSPATEVDELGPIGLFILTGEHLRALKLL
jgi:hypothetical protein